jgi:diguanylate cyclase (GGDEF)-like protein/PAS domain S-box-containing protein
MDPLLIQLIQELPQNGQITKNCFRQARFCQALLLTIAGISFFLGLIVILAWHLHWTSILQMIPESPPIRYNTALAFLLSGLAFGLTLRGKRGNQGAAVLSGLVVLIGCLSILQYVWDVDLGIDQLLMQDYLTPRSSATPFPTSSTAVQQFLIRVERPLPNTALSFIFVGVSLLCVVSCSRLQPPPAPRLSRWQSFPLAIATTLAAGVIGISSVAVLGYLAPIGKTYTWRYLTGLALPTAIGLVILGSGLFLLALSHPRVQKNPWWIPISAGFGVLMASLFLGQALTSWSQNLLLNRSEFATEVKALLIPVANIILLGGVFLALLVTAVLYFAQVAYRQTEQLKISNQEIVRSQSLLQSTLEATADGILVVTTPEREVKYFNPQLIEMWQVPESIVAAMKRGDSSQSMAFGLSLLKDPEEFLRATQKGMNQLESESLDLIEFKDGRIFERYSRPYWMNDSRSGTLRQTIVGKVLSYRDVTARKQTEAALQESESRFQAFMNNTPAVVFMKDEQGRYIYVNETLERSFNVKLEVLLGQTDFDWLPQEIAHKVTENDATVLATHQTIQYVETLPAPDGTLYHWLTFKFPFQDHAGHRYVGGVAVDITERKQMEEALFQEKELAQVTLDSIGDAVITTDAIGQIRYLNPVAESLTGWREEEAQGQALTSVFKIFHETTRIPVENPIEKALREDRIVELANHTILIARDGREISIDDSAAPIHDREGHIVGAVLVFHDVTHNRELSRQFSWQAQHDSLTGLINRREFEQRLEEALTIARQENQVHALCYMDLDQFKIVNDTCGHIAGDELLRQVTMLLQEQIRKTDTLARLGGDEFGVLLTQCPLDQAIAIGNTLREKVQAFRFIWQGNSFAIGVSIGLVEIKADSENLANLLIAADTACYAAKNNGRNRIHVFQRDDHELLQHQGEIRWVNRLTRALEDDRFVLQGELMASISSTESHEEHYEVLLRLQDEEGELVCPMAFIPAAERYNLMVQIDRWVIKKIFSNWASLQNKRLNQTHPIVYAINLSGSSINDDQFTDFLHQQFALYKVPPELICFEITETVAIANLTKASLFIDQLQQLGCRFALDDFGSGMSSFAYLKNLPVNYLKIDGGFIKNMVNDPVDYAMVEAINHIGHVMAIKTIAEWVEDDAILERVKALGIDYAQGYAMGQTRHLC